MLFLESLGAKLCAQCLRSAALRESMLRLDSLLSTLLSRHGLTNIFSHVDTEIGQTFELSGGFAINAMI